jgi:RimJ/RimL family protein N-acetyltransferase
MAEYDRGAGESTSNRRRLPGVSREVMRALIHPLPTNTIVRLRWPKPEDARTLLDYAQDPDMAKTHWFPIPLEPTAASVQLVVDDLCKGWNGSAGLSVVATEPRRDTLIAIFTLCRLVDANAAEIACGVAPRFRRRGVATQGLRLLAPWALLEFNLRRIEARIGRSQAISRRVAEQAGFHCEDDVRGYRSRPATRDRRYVLRV